MPAPARCLVGMLFLTVLVAAGAASLRTGVYGLALFVVAPAYLGGLAAWVRRPTAGARAAGLGAAAAAAGACFFLVLGLEGVLCIMMSLPLVAPLGALGGWLVYLGGSSLPSPRGLAVFLLLPPAALTWDAQAPPPVFEVRTGTVVAAAPEQVWRRVVGFSDLPDPPEWYFRAGVAFPIWALIDGSGPGAVRYCEFSTGTFVEPIEAWDEPRLLRFRVTENPAPMREWVRTPGSCRSICAGTWFPGKARSGWRDWRTAIPCWNGPPGINMGCGRRNIGDGGRTRSSIAFTAGF